MLLGCCLGFWGFKLCGCICFANWLVLILLLVTLVAWVVVGVVLGFADLLLLV